MSPVPTPEFSPDPALDRRLAELRCRFKTVLPERIAAIKARLTAMAQGTPSALEDLRTEVHSLAGSSGLFGFEAVGAAAGELERLLIAAAKQPAISDAAMEELMHAALRLEQSVHHAAS